MSNALFLESIPAATPNTLHTPSAAFVALGTKTDNTGTPDKVFYDAGGNRLGSLTRTAKAFVGYGGGTELGTTIPNAVSPVGTFTKKLKFQESITDDIGTVLDLANSRFVIPGGYFECRVYYNLAFGLVGWVGVTTYAVGDTVIPTAYGSYQYVATSITTGITGGAEPTWPVVDGNTVVDGGVTWTCRASGWANGWRGCRIKNSGGQNYGNQRIRSVGDGTTTNALYVSPWIRITTSASSAPNTIVAGDYFEFYPTQTSGQPMTCGADTASSFVQIEIR